VLATDRFAVRGLPLVRTLPICPTMYQPRSQRLRDPASHPRSTMHILPPPSPSSLPPLSVLPCHPRVSAACVSGSWVFSGLSAAKSLASAATQASHEARTGLCNPAQGSLRRSPSAHSSAELNNRLLFAGGMSSSASHDWATSRHVTNTSVNRSVALLGFADVQTVFAPRSLGAIGTASAVPGSGGPLGEHPDALRGLGVGPLDDKSGYGPAGLAVQYHQAQFGSGSSGQQSSSLVRQSIGSDLSDELRAHSRNGSFSYGNNTAASNPESPRYQPTFQQPGVGGGGGSAHHPLSAGSGLQPIMSGEPVISPDSLPPLPGYPDPSQYWQQPPQQGHSAGHMGGGIVPSFSTTSDYSNGGGGGGSYHGVPQLSMSRQGSGQQAPYGGGPAVQGSGGSFGSTPRRQHQQQMGDQNGGHGGGHTSLGAGLASGSYGRDAYAPPPQPPGSMYGPPLTPGRRSVSEELAVGGSMYGAPNNGVYNSSGSFTSGNSFTGASPRHGHQGGGGVGGRPGSAGGPVTQQGYGGGPGGGPNGRSNSFGAAARGRSYPPPPPHVGGGGGGGSMYRPGLASPKAPYSPRHGGGRDDASPFVGGGGGFDASRARGPQGGTGRGEAERGQGYRKLWAQVCRLCTLWL